MTEMRRPKVGDKVRLVVEGTVDGAYKAAGNEGHVIAIAGYEYYPEWQPAHITSVEIVASPCPATLSDYNRASRRVTPCVEDRGHSGRHHGDGFSWDSQ